MKTIANTKETAFTYCYVNGRKSAVVEYANGVTRLLYNANALGAGNGVDATRAEYSAAGQSLHQFNNYLELIGKGNDAINEAIPGAEIIWNGTPEYAAKVAAVTGTRGGSKPQQPESDRKPAAGTRPQDIPSIDLSNTVSDALRSAVGGLSTMVAAAITPAINKAANEALDVQIKQATAGAPSVDVIRIVWPDGSNTEIPGVTHAKLPAILALLKGGRHVYLYGPAGSGKSSAAKQAAEAIGLDYYPSQKIDDSLQLSGYTDAAGLFVETTFYKAFTKGGLFLADEVDRSDAAAVTWLQSTLENGFADFPGVGVVKAHPDFKCIAAGNTCGRGATHEYVAANQQDAAFTGRFAFLEVDYCPRVEESAAAGDSDLIDFARALRRAAKENGVSVICSPREIKWLAKFKDIFSPEENLSINLFKGLEIDQIAILANAVKCGGRWLEGLKKLAA